jgi:hypothetical protein
MIIPETVQKAPGGAVDEIMEVLAGEDNDCDDQGDH